MQNEDVAPAVAKVPVKTFALSPQAADALGASLATMGMSPDRVTTHVVSLGYRKDGVTIDRVRQAFTAHRQQG